MTRSDRVASLAGLAAIALLACLPGRSLAQDQPPSADLIAKGKYLTDMGDCIGCHQGSGYPAFAGGQYMQMPFGVISTPNITPDKDTGIGKYTDADFIRLMQRGIMPDGQRIYPAMPYPWYATVPKSDLLAIKAYLFSLKPVHAPRLENHIWFPFTIRPAIALWDAVFVPTKEFTPDPAKSAELNRGAYIVGGLEHCGTCHNKRNFLGNTAIAGNVEGAPITRWYAPNLRPDNLTGIGRFSVDDLVSFFKYGHAKSMGTVAGPMSEVVDLSTMHLSDSDLHAISVYIKSLPAVQVYTPTDGRFRPDAMAAGRAVYLSHCASCHQDNGQGVSERIPALDGNGMVQAGGPQDVIRIVLGGLEARGPYGLMPGVGAAMSDKEITSVTNYVRQAWSNKAPANATVLLTSLLRQDTHTLLNGSRPNGCPALAEQDLAKVLDDSSNGIGALLQSTNEANLLQNADTIISKVKAAAPQISREDLVNGLAVAYCPVVEKEPGLAESQRVWQITHFADRVYVQLTTNGAY